MNNIELLLKTVKEKINSQSLDISHTEILNLIGKNFYVLEALKFSTLLSNEVVKPIAIKIKDLEQTKDSLGSSRTNYKQRNHVLSNINDLKNLLNEVFILYHLYLKGDNFFQIYEKEENEKFSNYEDKIINGSLDEDAIESIMYPTYFDLEKIQNLSNIIKEHIKSLNLDKEKYEYAKYRTTSFYNRIKDSIYTISKTIDKSDTDLKHADIKLKKVNENETYEDGENSIPFNLYDYFHQNVIDLYNSLDNLNKHKMILVGLFQDLSKSYSYLADLRNLTPSKITVFGDSNFEKVKELANSLITYKFVSIHVSIDDLIEVFTLNEDKPINKINLTNGSLNDFGYLISQMKPFFIDSISDKANYSLWWSERFTFNSEPKNKKSVSNMVTALKKDRDSAQKETISKIVESLNPIPH